MKIEEFLNTFEGRRLLRKHHITAKGMDAIRAGYNKKGEKFMYDLLLGMSPKSSVLHGNYGDESEMGPPTFEQFTEQTKKKKLDYAGLLHMIGETGSTIAKLKSDILGKPQENENTGSGSGASPKSNWLLYGLGIAVVAVIIVLIVKK
ncbi:hypothetical protein JZU46_01120 [bacterium]|nr:hypothetical protein [bacterium]